MTDADLHGSTAAYVLAALPPDEELDFERHLRSCPACRREVRELSGTAARLGAAAATAPPPELRARVFAALDLHREAAVGLGERVGRRRVAPPWWRTPLAAVAAALLVASLGLGGVVVSERRADRETALAAEIGRIITDPSRVSVSAAIGGGTGTLVVAGDSAVFLGAELPALPADRSYQLWVIRPEQIRSAGVLAPTDGSAVQLVEGVGRSDTMGLTIEPARGSPQPTSTPLWRVRI